MSYWIVVVDDEPLSLTNAKNMLHSHGMRVGCLRSGSDLLEFVKTKTPDLILLDILMPEMDGFETYRALRRFEEKEGRPQIPVIFLTGEDNNEAERRGLKAGASDFIHKPFDEGILIKRINNTIVNRKTIESLTEEATMDKLTGFLNKASGTKRVTELCREERGALMIMDLDSFKLVNDLYGHDMGDRVLEAFSSVVRENVRAEDVVCRIGGDEFMGFFAEMTEESAVASLTKRLNTRLMQEADSLMGDDHGVPLGISIGVAVSNENANDYQLLFQFADNALYEVKRNGKHSYCIYDPEMTHEAEEENLEEDLNRVLQIVSERGEGKGALLLGIEAFSWNFRYMERFRQRYGGCGTRILFSLSSEEKGVLYTEMVSEFGNVLKNSLRKSDILMQWKKNKYLVVLPLLQESDIPKIIDRLRNAWEKTGYHERSEIRYVSSTVM